MAETFESTIIEKINQIISASKSDVENITACIKDICQIYDEAIANLRTRIEILEKK